jgi:hypothetical protein
MLVSWGATRADEAVYRGTTTVDLGTPRPVSGMIITHKQLAPADRRIGVALELLDADNRTVLYRERLDWESPRAAVVGPLEAIWVVERTGG